MDLDAKVGFAYVMNKMNSGALGDRRVVGPAMALFSGLQD
jgi:hypothetical protein